MRFENYTANVEVQDKLEQAIMRFVDAMDMDGLVSYVSADLREYYKAFEEKALQFIDEMEQAEGVQYD
tara:strand:- start:1868 stop:2071 length:204 start_codon:yes stop_codon:yes gene_type:complete